MKETNKKIYVLLCWGSGEFKCGTPNLNYVILNNQKAVIFVYFYTNMLLQMRTQVEKFGYSSYLHVLLRLKCLPTSGK